MKIILFALTFAFLSLPLSAGKGKSHYDNGVTEELARSRKQNIADVRYDILFSIPKERNMDIAGELTLRFTQKAKDDIVIDFRESADKLKRVELNGEPVEWTFTNEHIVIPKRKGKKGENEVKIVFIAGNQSLNRNDDFLYTLFVPDRARTVFPCFEQPNIKAVFTLRLEIPAEWEAVGNSYVKTTETTKGGSRKLLTFAPTEPLSTYLFAFAAGRFQHETYTEDGRTIGAYHRENDPKRIAQLPDIFRMVMASLRWQEEYTGIKYPFAKYDLVILPGFQFGGMEHTGATFYNDNTLFLSENPTPDEELSRMSLIAHETSHMWFGDLVTMAWFNDVWTKEVFANYYAAAITAPQFPQLDHELNWLKTYAAAAMSEDRSKGGTAIRQPLDNMQNAGLIYNQIIYNKAPVMMKKLVELMGEEPFREGIQEYLRTYSYSNAVWDDLIRILQSKTNKDVTGFSRVWVGEKGLPHLTLWIADGRLHVVQRDALDRGLLWHQEFTVKVCRGDAWQDVRVTMNSSDSVFVSDKLALVADGAQTNDEDIMIVPNSDGRGYGMFYVNERNTRWLLNTIANATNIAGLSNASRMAVLMVLYENYLCGNIGEKEWANAMTQALRKETDPLRASTLVSYLYMSMSMLDDTFKHETEKELFSISRTHTVNSCRTQLLRLLTSCATSLEITDSLYTIWKEQNCDLLSERDYMALAYELSIRRPMESTDILRTQRERIKNADRLRQFDFISRAAVADENALDTLFSSLLKAENRRTEPWAASALSLLNHPVRGERSVKYIRPALEALQDVQRSGDIFFPANWTAALLGRHRSREAYEEVEKFFAAHPDYPQLLKNKILNAAYGLYRANGDYNQHTTQVAP